MENSNSSKKFYNIDSADENGNATELADDNEGTTLYTCTCCAKEYYLYQDPFIVIKDAITSRNITYTMCNSCVLSFQKCTVCMIGFDEPWDVVYYNRTTKIHYCIKCHRKSIIHV